MTPSEREPLSEEKNAEHGWAELELPATFQEQEVWAKKYEKKGRGRPRSNPSLEEYTLKTILSSLESSVDHIFGHLADYDLWLRDDTALDKKHILDDGRLAYRIRVPVSGPNYRVGFSDGMRFAVEVFQRWLAPEMLSEMIEKNGLTLNATKEAIRREALKERNRKSEALAKFDQEMQEFLKKHHPLPSDILRKVRRPAVSRKEILRFIKALKTFDRPASFKDLAEELGATIEQVKDLYQEALRQRFPVKTGKDRKEREYLMI
ncbi:MAG: hypothetical protein WBG01_00820 [Bacteroidota bacterium]